MARDGPVVFAEDTCSSLVHSWTNFKPMVSEKCQVGYSAKEGFVFIVTFKILCIDI